MAEEKFQSIYGDAESEFDVEDVSDETLSISKEEIEEKIQEEASAEEPAPVEQASAEETAEAEEPATESAPAVEETAAEPEAESKDSDPAPAAAPEEPAADAGELDETDGITFEDHAVHYHGEDDESGYEPIAEHHHDHDDRANDHHAHEEDHDDHDDDHVSVISYILHAILFTIPVIGTILMLIYIISDNKNEHLRHFAQIWLITLLIIAIGAYAALTILGIA